MVTPWRQRIMFKYPHLDRYCGKYRFRCLHSVHGTNASARGACANLTSIRHLCARLNTPSLQRCVHAIQTLLSVTFMVFTIPSFFLLHELFFLLFVYTNFKSVNTWISHVSFSLSMCRKEAGIFKIFFC
jgi:hypothetical protein